MPWGDICTTCGRPHLIFDENCEPIIQPGEICEPNPTAVQTWFRDPFGIHAVERRLFEAWDLIRRGRLGNLPTPTHRTADIPYGRGEDTEVVWLGLINQRNLRDLYEVNMARTGVPLSQEEVKDPNLRERVLLYGTDGDETLTISIDRWKYPRFKEAIWGLSLDRDIVVIRGTRRGFMPNRIVYAEAMWVIQADNEDA